MDDVVADELKIGVIQKMTDIVFASGKEIVDADDVVSLVEEAFAEVAAQKAGASGDEDSLHASLLPSYP
jgi:hypothetical protein